MMSTFQKISIIAILLAFMGCSSSSDFKLDSKILVDTDWYYNAWVDQKYSTDFDSDDVIEILCFQKDYKVILKDINGNIDSELGTWYQDDNIITITKDGKDEKWIITKCNSNELRINKNKNEYSYSSKLSYLDGLYANLFWETRLKSSSRKDISLGCRIYSKKISRNPTVIYSSSQNEEMKSYSGYYGAFQEQNKVNERVRFYCRVDNNNFKFDKNVPSSNLHDLVEYDDFKLEVDNTEDEVTVAWEALSLNDIYYKIEIYKGTDESDLVFISNIERTGASNSNPYKISSKTSLSELNKLSSLKDNDRCTVRLVAIKYLSGHNPYNNDADYYREAVVYIEDEIVWKK